jgi:hypothetical protein
LTARFFTSLGHAKGRPFQPLEKAVARVSKAGKSLRPAAGGRS